jgi:hypothetical protein
LAKRRGTNGVLNVSGVEMEEDEKMGQGEDRVGKERLLDLGR